MAAAARALWALAALAAVARSGAETLEPIPVYFGNSACSGAVGGTTLCRGGTLGAPLVVGGATTYPNQMGGSPLWIKCVARARGAARGAACADACSLSSFGAAVSLGVVQRRRHASHGG
jgi:hypothetical protein